MAEHDSYEISAKYYDAGYGSKEDLTDLPFYLACIEQQGGPVLEVGCGTGRVLLPLARLGVEVHGLDNSAPMLKILQCHLVQEPENVQRQVKIHCGDLRSFDLGKKFAMILAPFRPLQHLYTLDDQIAALQRITAHLQANGLFVFDVFNPNFEMLADGIGEERPDLEWESGGLKIIRSFLKTDFDKLQQTFAGNFIYRSYQDGELVQEEIEPLKMSYYTYPHLQALFRIVGLEAMQEFGGFDERPLTADSPNMVFVLRPAGT